MQWNFHVEENNTNVKFEITYFDCESIRTNHWNEVCLFDIWKTGFCAKNWDFIPQLMTSSRSSTWIFIVIEKTVQNTI